ncbi:WD repeat-containing protein YMR102C-like isoform X2 [Cornus florida]|uniref:WD repeat-containing protein YMR102C-like isoform X2 n=1 Tax=Cornus florida TaxID=4283 RepID=UPI00289CB5EB|nr:WD repeat-containing protein YMR102C-like isoform X2 [Cornus florida]
MMASYGEAEEEQFFDTRDEIAPVSDSGSDCSQDSCSSSGHVNCDSDSLGDEFRTENLESVCERRHRFMKWMGLSLDQNPVEREEPGDNEIKMGMDRIRVTEDSGAGLRNSDFEDQFLSNCSEATGWMQDDISDEGNSECCIKNSEEGREILMDEISHHQTVGRSQEEAEAGDMVDMKKKVKRGWLKKLNVLSRITNRQGEDSLKPSDFKLELGTRVRRVRVHLHGKRSKELSSLYAEQEFSAHKGSILTMKFSPDGQYLASAGEDSVVRVWKVMEYERPNQFDIQDTDPSCLYFSVDHLSKFAHLDVDKNKIGKMKRLRKSTESACVVFPPKVFRISEKPLHQFHGHSCEVLALSWSSKGYLLSSSVDKTVRLWQLEHDQCLGVFSHNNYVTCIEFNPMDDNYFISGSIDGKVRIWEVHGCQVVDWTDIREIVTAVCYSPNGKGGIVGSMDGNCRFYDIIDNHLQLDDQINLNGKKKSACKRITGFQFSPSDPSKLMVTSADSQFRILSGVNVISKFKGSQVPASFTSDGKHIVSTSEDSHVNVWNCIGQEKTLSSTGKHSWSCESFLSHNAWIALPWNGMKNMSGSPTIPTFLGDDLLCRILRNAECDEDLHHKMPVSSPDCFSLSRGFFLESLPKGSATWPEEKLPDSSQVAGSPTMCKSEYKLSKSACQNTSSSPHMWGLLIVTAGWDGRIRTYYNYGLPIRL